MQNRRISTSDLIFLFLIVYFLNLCSYISHTHRLSLMSCDFCSFLSFCRRASTALSTCSLFRSYILVSTVLPSINSNKWPSQLSGHLGLNNHKILFDVKIKTKKWWVHMYIKIHVFFSPSPSLSFRQNRTSGVTALCSSSIVISCDLLLGMLSSIHPLLCSTSSASI